MQACRSYTMRGLLYENDKRYRLERKKQRLSNEKSFGACLRRFRIQKKIKANRVSKYVGKDYSTH